MSIACEPIEERHLEAARRFNQRLRSQGVDPVFRIQEHMPQVTSPRPIRTESFVAVERAPGAEEIRGGYLVQWRDFQVAGQVLRLGNYQTPISEGIVDKRFTSVGLLLLKHALKSHPYWYTTGMGGLDRPLPRILKTLGWSLQLVPLWLRPHHAGAFLREIRHLRTSRARRAALNALGWSGAGWLGLRLIESVAAARSTSVRFVAEPVDRFDDWADAFWERTAPHFPLAAVRTSAVLNTLYPPDDPRYVRLRVSQNGRLVGWTVLLRQRLSDNKYFGNMTAGVIADSLSAPADCLPVLLAASRELGRRGVDFSFANSPHAACGDALRKIGYLSGPSNYGFGLSKSLAALLQPIPNAMTRAHLMRGDGDGLSTILT